MHSEAERSARHVRLADEAVLLGPAPAAQSYLAVDRIVEAARRSGVSAVLPVPPALAGNARLAAAVREAGLLWVGPDPDVLERLGGDGVEPASERGLLAWVTADGLRFPTPVSRDRAAGIARVSWTPDGRTSVPAPPAGWPRSAGAGWSPSASHPTASWPRWRPASPSTSPSSSGRTASTPSSWPCAARRRRRNDAGGPASSPWRPAVAVQLRATLPPGEAGRIAGRLPGTGRPEPRAGGGRRRRRRRRVRAR